MKEIEAIANALVRVHELDPGAHAALFTGLGQIFEEIRSNAVGMSTGRTDSRIGTDRIARISRELLTEIAYGTDANGHRRTPSRARRPWAHLFDQDADRCEATARRLGVRVVVVHGRGTEVQHVDLCGKPLARAMAEAHRPAKAS
jgi:hypothetical protein